MSQAPQSIYPECISSDIVGGALKLEIPVEFIEPRPVCLIGDGISEASTLSLDHSDKELSLSLSALPPLMIDMVLPLSYPLHNPPQLRSIRATHLWLPQLLDLQNILTAMWQPGEGVLYSWVEFIRTGEFIHALGLTSSDNRIRITHPAPRILSSLLKDYEASAKYDRFSLNVYPCAICLTSRKGSKCLQLSCNHIFCRSCLEDFWKMCVAEGDVGRVGCPDPGCVKIGREADAEEVARVVTEAEVQRWRWLREKRSLEKDPSIIHCPMAFCQTAVPKPNDSDEGTGWDRLRLCPACSFSFCAFCRRTWHGPITACPIAESEKIVLEFLAHSDGSSERQMLQRRFGKNNVHKLVSAYQEEQANKQWLQSSTMACPGCQVHVEKSLGCNHMTCTKCRQHFCYRCGIKLPPSDPYSHFSTVGCACYNKLFDFQSEDEEWQLVGGFEFVDD